MKLANALHWLNTNGNQLPLDFDDEHGREREETVRVVDNMDAVLLNGTQLLLNQVYDRIGFNQIQDEILRHLVIARVSQPRSKLATVAYLKSYYDEDVDLNHIYRYMDKLYNTQKELVQQISVEHTRRILGGSIGLRRFGTHHRLLRRDHALLRDLQDRRAALSGLLEGRKDC